MKSSIQPLLVLVFVMGLLIQAAPLQQTASDGAHTHAEIERLRLDYIALEERVAILEYGRDSQATNTPIATDWELATLVSTITQSETPHSSPTRTPSATMTNTAQGQPGTSTPEVLQGTFTATPTFQPGTNTYTPTRTPVIAGVTVTPTVTDLPEMTYALNIGSVDRNVRSCPDLSCEVVAVVRVGETVVINLEQTIISQNYRWYALWNSDFNSPAWVTSERMDPYLRYLSWE